MGANHNIVYAALSLRVVVSNVPKILKWEQITTHLNSSHCMDSCFQCSKDTKMGANHNLTFNTSKNGVVVSNVPKILKWEQITTTSDLVP